MFGGRGRRESAAFTKGFCSRAQGRASTETAMKGDAKVIDALNDILTAELTAINQYFIHAKMCKNWGYKKLHAWKRKESIEEMKDADALIERILYLDGVPNMQRMNPVRVGEDVVEQHTLDLATETAAVERLNKAIELCYAAHDHGTRELLEGILKGEEHSADELEAHLGIIKDIGKENYLAQMFNS
jgi:bacterioferritin